MPSRKVYQVWIEDITGRETILFEGGKVKAYKFYKSNGGHGAGLHIGYLI